ncbi:MAG: NAD(P)-dependent oxidoreductase [Chloroflexi bacterium]|nr:NAD(P)-dependent oxidoreductase [Chloroflexota bacterium]
MSKQRILITGMSGLIGGLARRELEGKYELRALNRSPVEGVECFQADIADLTAIQPAFEAVDIVIHLAAVANVKAPWEEVLQHNIIGTYNVFEAARRARVKRILYASSAATILGYEQIFPYNALVTGRYEEVPQEWQMITHQSPTWPGGLYGCSKIWGEALGRHFSDTYGISVICLRISAVTREDRPLITQQYSSWLSHRDIAQMITKCIELPEEVRYDIFFAISNNKWSYRDLEHAQEVTGFEPQDSAEDYRTGADPSTA